MCIRTLVSYGAAVIYFHAVSCFYQMCNHDYMIAVTSSVCMFSVYIDREPQFTKLLGSSMCGQNVSVLIVMG